MGSNGWSTATFGDISLGIFDGPHATPKPADEGRIFLRIDNLHRGGLDLSDIRWISEDDWARWTRRVTPQADDIVFSYEANLGLFALIPRGFDGCLGRRLALIRPDRSKVDPRYLLYATLSPDFQAFLRSRTVHGSTVDRVSLKDFPTYEIPLPPLPEQRAIAEVLGSLDDKIELNRRMNRTLESMARALFKSWFVDFDPVHANAAGHPTLPPALAAHFPATFTPSPLGDIPEGWEVKPASDVLDINPKRKLKKGTVAPYLDMKNMPTEGFIAGEVIDREFKSGSKFINGDTLLARITPCLENGKTAYVDFLDGKQTGWGSTEYIVIRPNPSLPPEFAYYLARSETFRTYAIQSMTGTSGRQRVPPTCFDNHDIVAPFPEIADAFAAIVRPLMVKMRADETESRTLAALRDALLPTLLGGLTRLHFTLTTTGA